MAVKSPSQIFNQRTAVLTVFFLLIFSAVFARLFFLQIVKGSNLRKEAEDQHVVYKKLLPARGEILLKDPTTLETSAVATNIKKPLVYASPNNIENFEATAKTLSTVLDMPEKDILDKIDQKDKKYIPIKKQLSDDEEQKIKDLKLAGIYLDYETTRVYPEKNLLSQTLGFVGYKNDDKVGLYGLERYFEKDLAGVEGRLVQEKDTNGTWIFGTKQDNTPPVDGDNLVLTVDKTIQFKAESVIKNAVEKNSADAGSVIIANPKTGAIIAIANYPDFNPNEYNKVTDNKDFLSMAVTGSYEPGSIFKPLTMAAAVNEGKVGPDTTYEDSGSVVINKYTIKNSDGKAHGLQTMTQVLEESLNTGAIYAKDQIGNPVFFKYLKNFGFGELTGVELPESKGNLDNLKANIVVNYATASFGQGISVTPMQMIQAYTALANGGKMMKPYIVQSKILPSGEDVDTKPEVVSQVVSANTANTISAMLVNVVENGHGTKAAVPGYFIATKNGTAQVSRKDGKLGYEENTNVGSFIGYGPVEDPQFVMLVRIDHPRDVTFAEVTAAPAWGELAQFILNYYHIPPTRK